MNQAQREPEERSATFLVRIHKRENEPWRGDVVWVDEDREQSFTSMQELFYLINDTLRMDGSAS